MKVFQVLADRIGVPLAPDKTVGPVQQLTFLGFELCVPQMLTRIPEDKLAKYTTQIMEFRQASKCTLQEYQSVIGCLQWAAAVIAAGQPFIRRLIDQTIGVTKPHYFVRVTQEVKDDLEVWLTFFENFNGVTMFRPRKAETSATLSLYTDASPLGAGDVFQHKWFQLKYPLAWARLNITFRELFPILVVVYVFGKDFQNTTIIFHTDNQPIVHVLKNQTSKEKLVMVLVRNLVLVCLARNIKWLSTCLGSRTYSQIGYRVFRRHPSC